MAEFERYTENARRAVSLARNEASGAGAPEVDSLHLLLGIITADRPLIGSLVGIAVLDVIQEQILLRSKRAAPSNANSAERPLSNECKRILKQAEEQAASLSSANIGGEHLLLGVLADSKSKAYQILKKQGLELGALRQKLGGNAGAPASSGFMGKLKRTLGLR